MLTAFFCANADPVMAPIARQVTYQEFPQKFVYEEKTKAWHIRKQGFALGRMYFVPPKSGDELFYLRTLLTVTKGPASFEDLRQFNSITHATFYEACLARGLLKDDGEWRQCLLEVSYMQTGEQLTLGTRAQIPTGHMVKTLRSQSTCDSNMPSDQMLSTF